MVLLPLALTSTPAFEQALKDVGFEVLEEADLAKDSEIEWCAGPPMLIEWTPQVVQPLASSALRGKAPASCRGSGAQRVRDVHQVHAYRQEALLPHA